MILKRKPKDKVESFLLRCRKIRTDPIFSDVYYKSSTDPEVVGLTKALKLMRELKNLEPSVRYWIDPKALNDGIEGAEFRLGLNKTIDTGGKPSNLSQ